MESLAGTWGGAADEQPQRKQANETRLAIEMEVQGNSDLRLMES